ncbi:DUF1697 domain-containing protein [Hoeflea prorocentri]|uniref:DUF1697 domain-containing protein n=1 Tax=Hoeflea prorocentri TaxID=1922333 RepID=A0A9X3ZHP9_9HYPH|nr:DUF1697 domain-containing protein [Hoeflea prorocentri]MCY6382077.1 DUF1697 domain-containing protein [Hoeflea prorocentri]MDA5399877.1 DUF1697 domain-containing protein [Hoeflea prorocentri]
MTTGEHNWVALLRAIGPATHKVMSMSQLRQSCSKAGLQHVQTLLATGNLLFSSDRKRSELHELLTDILARHGLDNDVFLRQPGELRDVLVANPMTEAAKLRPNHMLVLFMNSPPNEKQVQALAAHDGPETMKCIGKEAYIDYVNGVGRSKATPARLEKMLGRKGTARNWNTVTKLVEKTSD